MAVAVARPGRPFHRWREVLLWGLAALVLAGIVVALVRGGAGAGSDDEAASDAVAETADGARTSDDAGGVASGAGGAAPTAAQAGTPGAVVPLEHIVRTADMRLRVRGDVVAAADRAAVVASSLGGFVSGSTTSSGGRTATAELTLRVPAARFEDARERLARLGRVEGTETAGEDVGGQLVDLDARLRSLRAEELALDGLLSRAADIGQVLQVRDRLTGVRTQIEQLAGQQAALQDRAALATIHVSMRRVGAPGGGAEDGSHGFGDSIETAADAFVAVVGGMAVVLGAGLPFALLALLAWPLVRLVRRSSTSAGSMGG